MLQLIIWIGWVIFEKSNGFYLMAALLCVRMLTGCNDRTSSNSTKPASSTESSISQPIPLQENSTPSEDAAVSSQSEQSAPEQQPLTYVSAGDVTDYSVEQVKGLVSQLLDKALTICSLGDCQDFDQENTAAMKTDTENGIIYAPVLHPTYNSTDEIREDMYTTFTKETADRQFAYMFDSIYRDFDGKLFCAYSATGYRKIHQWNVDTLQIVSLTEDKITVKMDCTVIDDTFPATLEVIRVSDHWVLGDTYFAHAQ